MTKDQDPPGGLPRKAEEQRARQERRRQGLTPAEAREYFHPKWSLADVPLPPETIDALRRYRRRDEREGDLRRRLENGEN